MADEVGVGSHGSGHAATETSAAVGGFVFCSVILLIYFTFYMLCRVHKYDKKYSKDYLFAKGNDMEQQTVLKSYIDKYKEHKQERAREKQYQVVNKTENDVS